MTKTYIAKRWPDRLRRCRQANSLIRTIGNCGRRFFWCRRDRSGAGPRRCGFFLNRDGRIYWRDSYSGRKLSCHVRWLGRGFTNGGTLNALVRAMAKWIATGSQLSVYAFWQPLYVCGGDVWGYGNDLEIVRDKAIEIGVVDMSPSSVMHIEAMRYGWSEQDLEPVDELGEAGA